MKDLFDEILRRLPDQVPGKDGHYDIDISHMDDWDLEDRKDAISRLLNLGFVPSRKVEDR